MTHPPHQLRARLWSWSLRWWLLQQPISLCIGILRKASRCFIATSRALHLHQSARLVAAAGKGARPRCCRTGAGSAARKMMENDLAGGTAHLIHFDAGKDALGGETLYEWHVTGRSLHERLLVHDGAAAARCSVELSSRAIRC